VTPVGPGTVDRAAFAVHLADRLRSAGAAAPLTGAARLAEALAAVPPSSRARLYWTARVALLQRHADLAVFDAVFDEVFGASLTGAIVEARWGAPPAPDLLVPARGGPDGAVEEGAGLPWATRPSVHATEEAADAGVAVPELRPSSRTGPADTPFDQLAPADVARLGRELGAALHTWPARRTHRHARHPSGHRVALRSTLAQARRTGWEPVELVTTRPRLRRRRLVVVCDVSQSMQAHATALLHLMRAATLALDAEVFAFSTTLTRLTPVLAHRSPEVAIDTATAAVVDRFGGTRIATNVRTLLRSRHGDATRGAIVVVASDGWDSDPPESLAAAMERLRRRSHRVVWLNPRAGAPGFEPRVGSMAAALPSCDRLLPARTFRDLADALVAISADLGGPVVSSRG
jgi:uncharacterized protein with von Willebrand factor type A (vWA) domain